MRPLPRFVTKSLLITAFVATPLTLAANDPAAPSDLDFWMRKHAVPFTGVAAGTGFTDLEPLRAMIGDVRVVALGEPTHGSREVFQLKHRLVEFLASEMGFTLFAIEANMPEARLVNDYVNGARLDLAALIRGMGFWTWETEEVREMLEWMRAFNADPENRRRGRAIAFTGFDMQDPTAAAANVRTFIAAQHPEKRTAVDAAMTSLTASRSATTGFANGRLPVEKLRGRRLVISGWIKTRDVGPGGWAGFWCSASTGGPAPAIFKNNSANAARGTTEWIRYDLAIDVPANATATMFGLMLQGSGQAWFDDLTFTVDGRTLRPDDIDTGFEAPTILGFPLRSEAGYTVALVPDAHSGQQSLRIAGTGIDATTSTGGAWNDLAATLLAASSDYADENTRRQAGWVAHQARLVAQWHACREQTLTRDAAMAENVLWLLAQEPATKVVLWAHNGHVARRDGAMGDLLGRNLGSEMFVVGFSTGMGTYRAVARGSTGPTVARLQRPPADSVEARLAATNIPRFVLDLRSCRQTGAEGHAGRWFLDPHPHRQVGSGAMERQFQPRVVARDFDAMVWLDRTTASVPLGSDGGQP